MQKTHKENRETTIIHEEFMHSEIKLEGNNINPDTKTGGKKEETRRSIKATEERD